MTAPTRTRWACPHAATTACPAVLAPTQPRRDDARRFCLPCTARTGKLVPRVAPTLAKERAAAKEAARLRALGQKATRTLAAFLRFSAGGVDLRTVVAQAYDLPVAREWRVRRRLPPAPPALAVRRSHGARSVVGRAWMHQHRISVTIFPYVGEGGKMDLAKADVPFGTILHEVAHILVGSETVGPRRLAHGPKFDTCLRQMLREYHERFPATPRLAVHRTTLVPKLATFLPPRPDANAAAMEST